VSSPKLDATDMSKALKRRLSEKVGFSLLSGQAERQREREDAWVLATFF